ADLGSELGESRSAATAVAPAPDGAGAHPVDEPVASGSSERRAALQEEVMAGARAGTTGVVSLSSLGQPTTGGSTEAAGSAEPDHRGADPSDRTGSREMSGGAALDDASWGGRTDGTSLRADHRKGRAIPVWETDCLLSGTGAPGGLEWRTEAAGAYHEARQCSAALLVSGSGASYGTHDSAMAQYVLPPGDAPGTEDRQSSAGTETGGSSVLDDAPGMELRAGTKVRFARGNARKSPWCAREHREIDWGIPLLLNEEFEVVILIAVATEEMHGSDRFGPETDYERALVGLAMFSCFATSSARAKWALCHECGR